MGEIVASIAEDKLLERAKSGDLDAFETILAPLIEPAHRLACALLHDHPDLADDAVQEASVRAWRKLGRVRTGGSFRLWFLGIVANQCRDQRRSRWWQVIPMPEPRARAPEATEDTAMRRAQLREALMKLGNREREVLVLRVYLDLPWSEVATVAGLTEAGARTRYYRALERLRPFYGSREVLT